MTIKYEFGNAPSTRSIDIDKMARVKQITIWGDSGTVKVNAAANERAPYEPVIDTATGEQLVIDGTEKTFTLVDYYVSSFQLEAAPTGTWYVAVETWG